MLASTEINPKNSLYYIGAQMIEVLRQGTDSEMDMLELYARMNSKRKISMKLFILALDWLYLIDAIKKTRRNNIELCI